MTDHGDETSGPYGFDPDWPACTCGRLNPGHAAIHLSSDAADACVDAGVAPLVAAIWAAGHDTGETCEGHEDDPDDTDGHGRTRAHLVVPVPTLRMLSAAVGQDRAERIVGDGPDPWDPPMLFLDWADDGPDAPTVAIGLHPPKAELDDLADAVLAWARSQGPLRPVAAPHGWDAP